MGTPKDVERTLTVAEQATLANIRDVTQRQLFDNETIPSEVRAAARRKLTGEEALLYIREAIRQRSE